MDASQARGFLTQVELLHDREYNKDVLQTIFKNLKDIHVDVGVSVVKQMERSAPEGKRSYLPTPKDLIHILQQENARLNPTPDKTLEALNALPKPGEPAKKNCRMACRLVELILSGKATRGQVVDLFDKAHADEPGAGWAEQGRKLAVHYQRRGLKHDERPSVTVGETV